VQGSGHSSLAALIVSTFLLERTALDKRFLKIGASFAVANAEEVCKVFMEANVEVIVNADQMFLCFYPKHEYVLAPQGCKRVGGRSGQMRNEKAGCTLMVLPPFIMLNGRKKVKAKKFRNWNSRPGHTTTITTVQEKNWFDEHITIEYLEFMLKCYRHKIGLGLVWVWDAAAPLTVL
jgi:hypothetical protein